MANPSWDEEATRFHARPLAWIQEWLDTNGGSIEFTKDEHGRYVTVLSAKGRPALSTGVHKSVDQSAVNAIQGLAALDGITKQG